MEWVQNPIYKIEEPKNYVRRYYLQ